MSDKVYINNRGNRVEVGPICRMFTIYEWVTRDCPKPRSRDFSHPQLAQAELDRRAKKHGWKEDKT